MKKRNTLMVVMLLMVLSIVACGSNEEVEYDLTQSDEVENLPIMTIEEVAKNNGQDGNNAYIIVDNIVYDVTNSSRWTDGKHNDFEAGQDLSNEIDEVSPHGRRVLDNIEKVGRIE